jgi:tetratricopeptide (TPR) repeat protein
VLGRHRSLDAAVGWSYDLLGPIGQRLARRAAVFEGGWTIEAAEAVCAVGAAEAADVAAELARLVEASFVSFDPNAGRYGMLATVQAFARARLDAAGETALARDAHLAWCVRLAADAAPGLAGDDVGIWARRLEGEEPNLSAALRWALADDGRIDEAVHLAHDLTVFWAYVETNREAADWIRQVLDRPGPLTVERVELTLGLAAQLFELGDHRGGCDLCETALDQARSLDDPRLLSRCLTDAAFAGVLDERTGLLLEARSIAEELGDGDLAARSIHMLGLLAYRTGRYDDAVSLWEESVATGTDRYYNLGTRLRLAEVHEIRGRWDDARELLLTVERREADTSAEAACVCLTRVELAQGNLDAARRAFGRAAIWGRPIDDDPHGQLRFDAIGALAQAELGDLATAAATARRIGAIRADISGHGSMCDVGCRPAKSSYGPATSPPPTGVSATSSVTGSAVGRTTVPTASMPSPPRSRLTIRRPPPTSPPSPGPSGPAMASWHHHGSRSR